MRKIIYYTVFSFIWFMICSYIFGYRSYFAFGVLVALILAATQFPKFITDKENVHYLYVIIFAIDVILWPTYVLVNILANKKHELS